MEHEFQNELDMNTVIWRISFTPGGPVRFSTLRLEWPLEWPLHLGQARTLEKVKAITATYTFETTSPEISVTRPK